MQLEQELRLIARQRIAEGRLPSAPPARMWGGYATGELCSLCNQPILPEQVIYEVEATLGGTLRSFNFHAICQSSWQQECAHGAHLNAVADGR